MTPYIERYEVATDERVRGRIVWKDRFYVHVPFDSREEAAEFAKALPQMLALARQMGVATK